MNYDEMLTTVLLGPHLSEKTTRIGDAHNQVTFRVRSDATKQDIARAVEKMFDVKVDHVRVLNRPGKLRRRVGGKRGRQSGFKKAYVRLAEGHDIDFLGRD